MGVNFLCNSYFHLKSRQTAVMSDAVDALGSLSDRSAETAEFLLAYLADNDKLLKPFLLESQFREVRHNFAQLVYRSVRSYEKHNGNTETDHVNLILATFASFLESDVAQNCSRSNQFFSLLAKIAQMGSDQCGQMFRLNFFSHLVKFLLGVECDPGEDFDPKKHHRRWGSTQSKDFAELHAVICALIQADDGSATSVSQLLYGAASPVYIRESVSAVREINSVSRTIISVLVKATKERADFSNSLLGELLRQYNSVNSGEMKNLSNLLLEVLTLEDFLQLSRIKSALEGDDGLLAVIKNNQTSDSCRSYQCIKTLVNSAHKSGKVKEYLLTNDPNRWQWAVNWLKQKMGGVDAASPFSPSSTTSSGYSSSYWSSGSGSSSNNHDIASNEDSTTRTFHRTTSAQVCIAKRIQCPPIIPESSGPANLPVISGSSL